jgi:nitroimidazol reductase NimA-like FMN-containing flavoprotein (pyridoxamine 5'-phosphate oxidase superfamily)
VHIIPDAYRDLLTVESKAFAVLGTTGSDQMPVLTPIWFVSDDEHIIFLTSPNSRKVHNLAENPQLSLVIMQEGDHLRYLEVRGEIAARIEEKDVELQSHLWHKYTGRDPGHEYGDQIIFKIKPTYAKGWDYR